MVFANVIGKRLLFVISLLVLLSSKVAGITYTPPVRNYSVNEYKAGNQNWSVAQGKNGWMYFGNNRGLLVFDGVRWQLKTLPNGNAARSIYVAPDERIYVGSFEEFGYFEIDNKGLFTYTSLKDSVSGYDFYNDEIWSIHPHEGKIYFQSFASFFIYDSEKVIKGESELGPLYFFSLNGELYAQFLKGGFCRKTKDGFEELFPRSAINDDDVVAVLPYGDKLLLTTVMNGLYLYDKGKLTAWNTPAGEWLKTAIANRAVVLNDSIYAVGTISNGLIVFNDQGKILWRISRDNNLINNTVLGLFTDKDDNLWVALDNGIAQIQPRSPILYADFSGMSIGMVNDMLINNGIAYLATNQGVYSITEKDNIPRMLPGSEEQSWYISKQDNQMFVGHNRGTLLIENNRISRLFDYYGGGMALTKCVIHGKEILLQASYTALSVFVKDQYGRWDFSHNVEGFSNLLKSLEVDPSGNIWASHMYKGLYRIQLDNTLRKVKEMEYIGRLDPDGRDGLVRVMKLRGRIVLADGRQFYTYDDMSHQIIPYEQLNEKYSDLADTYRIVPYDNDHFWFINTSEYVLLAYQDGALSLKSRIPFSIFNNPPIEDRGTVYVDRNNVSYFCLNDEIARFIPENLREEQEPVALSLSSLKGSNRNNNKFVYLPLQPGGERAVLNYTFNNVTFDFSYPYFMEKSYSIRYWLEGFESEWSSGSNDFTKTYSNLPNGSYVLHAVVHNMMNNKDTSFSYPFTIKPPYYKSASAYTVYFFISIVFLALLIRGYVNWALSREKKNAAKHHRQQQEQLKMQEQVIIKLEKEKLEDELTYKSKELASATLSVISHNEFLEQLKSEVQAQKLTGGYSKAFFDRLIRMINDNITKEGDWTVFQSNFDRIHENFFVKLKSRYPDLTPGDLRMCALLRLNMPTKDMAGMLNLSVRGVEAARYRLRKKLNLPEGESLTNFVITFE